MHTQIDVPFLQSVYERMRLRVMQSSSRAPCRPALSPPPHLIDFIELVLLLLERLQGHLQHTTHRQVPTPPQHWATSCATARASCLQALYGCLPGRRCVHWPVVGQCMRCLAQPSGPPPNAPTRPACFFFSYIFVPEASSSSDRISGGFMLSTCRRHASRPGP